MRELEKNTATKINVPSIADNSDVITITGTKEGIEKAEHEIRVCSEEQVSFKELVMYESSSTSFMMIDFYFYLHNKHILSLDEYYI